MDHTKCGDSHLPVYYEDLVFNGGSKRATMIFANYYLISKGEGMLAILESHVPGLKKLLVTYYENRDNGKMIAFMRKNCWRTF